MNAISPASSYLDILFWRNFFSEKINVDIRNTYFKVIIVSAFVILATILRRPDQFFFPYVWVEDGLKNIPDYMEYDIFSIFLPVSGYLIIPSKLITILSSKISFLYYPEISYILTLAMCVGVALAITFSPTLFPGRPFAAMAVFIVPLMPEVYGTSHYVFWITSLLVCLPILWNYEDKRAFLRLFYIFFGGLSSPLIIGVLPLYLLRVLMTRKRIDLLLLTIVFIVSSIQFLMTKISAPEAPFKYITKIGNLFQHMPLMIEKFLSYFYLYKVFPSQSIGHVLSGFLLIAFIMYVSAIEAKKKNYVHISLMYLFFMTCVLVTLRSSIEIIHPYISCAPRYFFYPYVFLTWLLVSFVFSRSIGQWVKVLSLIILLLSFSLAFRSFYLRHEPINWRSELVACLKDEKDTIPVHYTGLKIHSKNFSFKLTPQECKRLIQDSLIFNKIETP